MWSSVAAAAATVMSPAVVAAGPSDFSSGSAYSSARPDALGFGSASAEHTFDRSTGAFSFAIAAEENAPLPAAATAATGLVSDSIGRSSADFSANLTRQWGQVGPGVWLVALRLRGLTVDAAAAGDATGAMSVFLRSPACFSCSSLDEASGVETSRFYSVSAPARCCDESEVVVQRVIRVHEPSVLQITATIGSGVSAGDAPLTALHRAGSASITASAAGSSWELTRLQ